MANMSYCRFHNTVIDFEDCAQELLDQAFNPEETEPLSRSELEKAFELIDLMVGLLEDFYVDIDHNQIKSIKAMILENQNEAH